MIRCIEALQDRVGMICKARIFIYRRNSQQDELQDHVIDHARRKTVFFLFEISLRRKIFPTLLSTPCVDNYPNLSKTTLGESSEVRIRLNRLCGSRDIKGPFRLHQSHLDNK